MKSETDLKIEGQVASLKYTIKTVREFLQTDSLPSDPMVLRVLLERLIGDVAEKQYKRGFNRGHRQSYKKFKKTKKVPKTLCFTARQRKIAYKQVRTIKARSKIKPQ
jgi:collagenase-like PrtC family protease